MSVGALRRSISRVDTEYGQVLLDEVESRYWYANPTAALLLEVLEQGGDAEQAARRIAREFDIDEDIALFDVRSVIDQLRELGILT